MEIGAGVGEEGHAGSFDFFFEVVAAAVPAVVIARAGNDAVGGLEIFEGFGKLRERGGIIDDEVAGHGNQIGFFIDEGLPDFGDEFVVASGAVVDVGNLGEAKAVERLGPTGQGEVMAGDGEEIGLNRGGPNSAGETDSEESKSGSSGGSFEAEFRTLAGHDGVMDPWWGG